MHTKIQKYQNQNFSAQDSAPSGPWPLRPLPFYSELIVTRAPSRLGVPCGSAVRNSQPMQETRLRSLGLEDLLEKEMATHSSILAWKSYRQRGLAGYSP